MILNIEVMAKEVSFEDAVKIVCRVRFGSMDALEKKIGQSNLRRMKTMGFVACGKNYTERRMVDTWKATQSVLDFKKRMYGGLIFSF